MLYLDGAGDPDVNGAYYLSSSVARADREESSFIKRALPTEDVTGPTRTFIIHRRIRIDGGEIQSERVLHWYIYSFVEGVGSNGNVRSGTEGVADRQGGYGTSDTVSKNYVMESREKKGKKVRMRIYDTDVTKLSYAAVVCKNM